MSNQQKDHNDTSFCHGANLTVLLSGNEQSDEFRQLATHLDSCERCRHRLTDMAASCEEWDDVSSMLSGYDQADGFTVNKTASREPQLDLSFLSPPSHPEMLGRIGRYEIEKVIGSGGMGVVLKGHDTELNRPVAIKVLAPFLAHSGAARQRFAREGRAAAAVVQEHVVAIHNVETDAEMPFLVMQYVPGQSLQTRVDAHGPLSAKEILRIGIQAAAGLAAAHAQGVVHRDIKPSNILLENGVERTLLTDFGLARAADDATVTRTGVIAGTPHYMSPEQATGGSVDNRSDLFSLGAVLYFMATGHPPFRAERPLAVLNRICNDQHRPVWDVNPDIPDDLADIIDTLLEKKPDRRFTGANQTHDVLLKLLEKLQQPGGMRNRSALRRWFRSHRGQVATTLAALAGVAVVALGLSGLFSSIKPGTTDSKVDNAIGKVKSSPKTEPTESEKQKILELALNNAREAAQQTVSSVLAADVNPSKAFMAELSDLESETQKIMGENMASSQYAPQNIDANWHDDVEAIKVQLLQLENSMSGNVSAKPTPTYPSSGEEK